MIRTRSIMFSGCVALALIGFASGCVTSSTGKAQARLRVSPSACENCTIQVVDRIALPVSSDLEVARLDQSWTVLEHSCSCCDGLTTQFFAGADFQDNCVKGETAGLCCVDAREQTGGTGLASVTH